MAMVVGVQAVMDLVFKVSFVVAQQSPPGPTLQIASQVPEVLRLFDPLAVSSDLVTVGQHRSCWQIGLRRC